MVEKLKALLVLNAIQKLGITADSDVKAWHCRRCLPLDCQPARCLCILIQPYILKCCRTMCSLTAFVGEVCSKSKCLWRLAR